ncbi:MAG: hypothetical protein K2X87_23490 [Gemmataceae bacterium]|nr:hypothetical protein [Gemmataceae bacterium]
MIRFRCPTCDRGYVLADALAGLPLLCKGCGQRLTPPPPEPDPEPEPPPARKAAAASGGRQPPDGRNHQGADAPRSPTTANPPDDLFTPPLAEEIGEPGSPGGGVGPTAGTPLHPPTRRGLADRGDLPRRGGGEDRVVPKSATPGPAPTPTGGRRLVGLVVDAAVFLILLAAGVLAGEAVAGKPTRQVLADAEAAPNFPPTDLLLWAAGPVVFGLAYLWLGTRGWTVGGWLRRRAGA